MQAAAQAAAQAEADDPQSTEQRVARVARLFARACAAAGWSATVPLASVSFDGHAGGALALARASADLAADRIDLAVVGGVASWLDEDTLQWLLNTGRLKCDANPSGFQPGEAASLLVLRRARGDGASPVIGPVAIAHDARSLYSGLPAYGEGLAAAIGAVAGMMVAPIVFLDPNMMSGILLYGFAAALLGGIDNPWGAVIGGFIVGVLENLLGAYVIGTELKLSVALVLIVGTLTLRPDGLFGKAVVTRV
jgi:hypothetical protein